MSSTPPQPPPSGDEPLKQRLRGRVPGTSQSKRKPEEELSSNFHSVKRRQREATLTLLEQRVEKAKAADRTAISTALRALKKSSDYIAANEDRKKEMEEAKKKEVVQKRIVQKRHHTVLEYELGMGEAGGLYALVDDGNPAWEDVEEEDEVLATVMARHDEAENGDVVKEVGEKVLKAYSSYTFVTGSKRFKDVVFRRFQKGWKPSVRSLGRLLKSLNMKRIEDFRGPVYDVRTKKIYEQWLPHMLFTDKELAIFRNCSCWLSAEEEEEWIDLPGPAALWPDDYDLEEFGFGLPPLMKSPLYRRAFEIAVLEKGEPEDFALLLPSSEELVMMQEGDWATKLVQGFYSLID